jgi:glycosyltransferase involved in cell wall biosynthesis
MSLFLILPAFNEAKIIGAVLKNASQQLKKLNIKDFKIIVVDDGSLDQTASIAETHGAVVLRHFLNRGLGGALGTGIAYAKKKKADMVITFDSDGQHDPKDITKLIKPIQENKADVVIGVRNRKKMPLDRKIITFGSSLLTFLFFGIYSPDTQSGMRAFNKKAIKKIKIKTQRMEVSSELFHEIKVHKLRLKHAPIKVIYTKYSRDKGQKNTNAIKILVKLIMRLFR